MLELYHSGNTTCSKQVRQHLNEKEVPYASRYIELWSHQNLAPEYLKLNPVGVVPTLVHDGVPIINSFCIMEYIEDVFPQSPLRPADPAQRAKQRLWSWLADDVHPSVANATYNQQMRARHSKLDKASIDKIASRMPAPERRERFLRTATDGFTPADIDAAWTRIDYVLGRFEQALEPGPWICGNDYSIGDIAMLAIVARIQELRAAHLGRFPRTAAWLKRSFERPAVQKVYALGTDETPARPQAVTANA
jgi:glutathione S-transferase